ncbi:hypothetical protein HPB50_016826 [Hyalomma asiaticum]|uniref:Uncharacterized protein n=1 Tax=Hyalomma asiaticum TaxID=266040 RepID=A0ACB7S427_HYAAI|nr:hypothetical protein HPB50_016826 [Hyalomma asiaticum]
MSSVPASDDGSLLAGPVELVPSLRGKDKAKYLDRTFTLESSSGLRHRWRCDQRQCKSRLITDFYGGVHMVYKYRGHDEDVHRLVESKRKSRREETYNQNTVKFGDYRYVLERRVERLASWRCIHEYCPGRNDKCSDAPGGAAHVGDDVAPGSRDVPEHSSRDAVMREEQDQELTEPQPKRPTLQLEKHVQVRLMLHQEQPDDRSRSPSTSSDMATTSNVEFNMKPRVKWESPSPVYPKQAFLDRPMNADGLSSKNVKVKAVRAFQEYWAQKLVDRSIAKAGTLPGKSINECHTRGVKRERSPEDKDCIYEDDRSTVSNASSGEASGNIDEGDVKEPRKWEPLANTEGAEETSAHRHIGVKEAGSRRIGNMSNSFARGDNGTSDSHRGHDVAEWLPTGNSCKSSRERKLPEDLLLQARHLLEAETELAKERRRTQVLVGRLLVRKVGSVPDAVP